MRTSFRASLTRTLVLFTVTAAVPLAAGADPLEEQFNTVWESLWTQNGFPAVVVRWMGEIRVRFSGSEASEHRDYAFRALRQATEVAGIALRDVTNEDDGGDANLEFQLLRREELTGKMACRTQLQRVRGAMVEKVLIQVRARSIAYCGYHEVMHAMGIRGHPSGDTVLRYFDPRPHDGLMPMDVLMLKAWYSPRMKAGATPFEALQVLTDAVIETAVAAPQRKDAKKAQADFLRRTLLEMERYANGEGEVPTVVLRSGWATDRAMNAGRARMAYFVGLAHLYGIGALADDGQAQKWFLIAAEKGDVAGKAMLLQPVVTPAPSSGAPRAATDTGGQAEPQVLGAAKAHPAEERTKPAGIGSALAVGWLDSGYSGRVALSDIAFARSMRELGWIEGKNLVFVRRYAEGNEERLPELAAQLVELGVNVLIAGDSFAIRPAMTATNRIPIVMIVSGDPVASGYVSSLGKPGGNVTGLTVMSADLAAKRLQLLREILPRQSRIAVIGPADRSDWKELTLASEKLGLQLQPLKISRSEELPKAFESASQQHAAAAMILPSPMTNRSSRQIVELASIYRLPTMYGLKYPVMLGGLIAYGPDVDQLFGRAAFYVDKLLKGSKPQELPVEQPTKFELVVNLRTARALGVDIPTALLIEANNVIR